MAGHRRPSGVSQRTLEAEPDPPATPDLAAPPPAPPPDAAAPPKQYAPVRPSADELWQRQLAWLRVRQRAASTTKEPGGAP